MTRITVTGATGFIGRRLVQHLMASGHEMTVLLHLTEGPSPFGPAVQAVSGDVTRPETLAGQFAECDLVIHLAGCTIARRSEEYDRVNRDGTLNVAKECARQASPPKMLFVSSLAAAGPTTDARLLKESDRPQPVSDYGRSKLAAERGLLAMAADLPIQIVRPPSVLGDTDPYLLGLFKTAKWGWVFLPGGATHRYSFIHVDDLAMALAHVAAIDEAGMEFPRGRQTTGDQESWTGGRLVFAAQDPPMTFPEVAAVVADELGKGSVRSIHIPAVFCWPVAAANSVAARILGVRPLLNMDKMREGLAGGWACDSSRLTGQLGFQFGVSLENRIRQTAKSYQQKGWL